MRKNSCVEELIVISLGLSKSITMKKACHHHIFALIMFLFLSFPMIVKGEVENNIIIPEEHHLITLSTEGSGDRIRIGKIKHEQNVTYTSTRVPDEVMVMFPYDKTQSVDKAKCKGSVPEYRKLWSSDLFHDDSRACVMKLSLEPGKNSDVQFTTTTTRPGFSTLMYIGNIYPVRNFSITYKMPVELKGIIDVAERNLPDSLNVTREVVSNGKEYQIQLTAKNIPAMKLEEGSPYARMILPHIMMTGLFSDVNELYTYLHGFTTAEDPAASTVTDFALDLTKDCETDMERLEVIQDWVRDNIRYVAIETGDLGYIPDLPSEVLKKRFGDCKGSASLIKAMLRGVGIDGRLVWIGTSSIPEDFTDVPNPGIGNHMIAAALLNDSIYYVDGTVGAAPQGYYSPSIQGKQTIIEDGNLPLIHRVPVLSPDASCDSVIIHGTLAEDKVIGSMTELISGYFKAALANRYKMADDDRKNKMASAYLSEGRTNFSFVAPRIDNLEPEEEYARVSAIVKIEKTTTESGGKVYFNPSLYQIRDSKVNMKNRTQPFFRVVRCRVVRELHLTIPENMTVEKLPEDFHLDNRFMDASLTYSRDGDEVICRFVLVWKDQMVPYAELKGYNDDITKVSKALSQRIQLSKS